jgi:hypothetical protein
MVASLSGLDRGTLLEVTCSVFEAADSERRKRI